MANRNTKQKRAAASKELAGKKKSNPDFRQSSPSQKHKPKVMDMYKNFPGFRKSGKESKPAPIVTAKAVNLIEAAEKVAA